MIWENDEQQQKQTYKKKTKPKSTFDILKLINVIYYPVLYKVIWLQCENPKAGY